MPPGAAVRRAAFVNGSAGSSGAVRWQAHGGKTPMQRKNEKAPRRERGACRFFRLKRRRVFSLSNPAGANRRALARSGGPSNPFSPCRRGGCGREIAGAWARGIVQRFVRRLSYENKV